MCKLEVRNAFARAPFRPDMVHLFSRQFDAVGSHLNADMAIGWVALSFGLAESPEVFAMRTEVKQRVRRSQCASNEPLSGWGAFLSSFSWEVRYSRSLK